MKQGRYRLPVDRRAEWGRRRCNRTWKKQRWLDASLKVGKRNRRRSPERL